jgi:rhodanese-related sulfurtransferase
MSTSRKPGVASPAEIAAFLIAHPAAVVVDARDPSSAEPSANLRPLPPSPSHPRAISAPIVRASGVLDLQRIPAGSAVITHCGGGGRGQKAREFLLKNKFKNGINGGGPEDAECWAIFGHL